MAKLPPSLQKVALFFERLPGIGSKTANRLAFYLLRMPEAELEEFGRYIAQLKQKTNMCKICYNLTEDEICSICSDVTRDRTIVTVVEDVLDLLSFETGDIYHGVYHVLHGKIDPLNHVGPDDIYIQPFIKRMKGDLPADLANYTKMPKEVILATNPDMEGEATAMYLRNQLNHLKEENDITFSITRLGYGMPMGGNLEYADYMTLRKAIENRNEFR